jgi:hypothetical protein
MRLYSVGRAVVALHLVYLPLIVVAESICFTGLHSIFVPLRRASTHASNFMKKAVRSYQLCDAILYLPHVLLPSTPDLCYHPRGW